MPTCPRCDRAISQTAIRCPHCDLELKAHGHPGMDLYRAKGTTPLCATCTYDADDSCTFDKRPNAMTCTLYQDSQAPKPKPRETIYPVQTWRKNSFRLALFLIVVFSLLVLSL